MRLRDSRTQLGWTQAKLAEQAGVSRQLVSAVESGRHEPGVSAALALAAAVGVSVEVLFGSERGREIAAVPVVGDTVPEGPVRAGLVGGSAVMVPVSPLDELDGTVVEGRWTGSAVELAPGAEPASVVLAGCEPALGVLAGMASDRAGALWVKASSGEARAALDAGRAHFAAIHDRADRLPTTPGGVVAFELARWRVGLAYDRGQVGSAAEAVESGGAVVQRDRSAGTQAAFERWVRRGHRVRPSGPRAPGHVEVCRIVHTGGAVAGVTAEPAAVAAGLGFEALEEHVVQLWCRRDMGGEAPVAELMDRFTSAAFAQRMAAMPAYDLAGLGTEAA
ncbi:MAG: substrate-binding domain-containing protein [Microthrixaceae bacterium]